MIKVQSYKKKKNSLKMRRKVKIMKITKIKTNQIWSAKIFLQTSLHKNRRKSLRISLKNTKFWINYKFQKIRKNLIKIFRLAKIILRLQKNQLSQDIIFPRKRIKIDYHTLARMFPKKKVSINQNKNKSNSNKKNKKK